MSALSDYFQSLLASPGANQPVGPQGAPSYGIGPGVLGMADPMRMTGVPGAPAMGYPALGWPASPPGVGQTQTNDPLGSYVAAGAGQPPVGTLGAAPAYDPLSSIQSPSPPRGAPGRAIPVAPSLANAPLPPPRPKGKIDPKTVDLGMNRRFVPIQYQVPSGRGPLGNNPIYTALNFGGRS